MRSQQTIVVSRREAGRTVAAVLRARLGLEAAAARRLLAARGVRLDGVSCVDPARRVRAGQRLRVQRPAPGPTLPQGLAPRIRYADAHVLVVDKPAGLTTMRHA